MTQQTERDIYNSNHRDNQIAPDNNIASTGLLLGILLVGLGVGTFFLTQENNPNPNQTTIIEKTQQAVPQPKAPDVNITVPNPEPVKMPDVNVNIPSPAPQNSTPAAEPATAKP